MREREKERERQPTYLSVGACSEHDSSAFSSSDVCSLWRNRPVKQRGGEADGGGARGSGR